MAAPSGTRGSALDTLAAAVRAVILLAGLTMIALRGWLQEAGAAGQVIAWLGAAYLLVSVVLAWKAAAAFEKNSLAFTSIDVLWITWLVWITKDRGPQYLLYYVPILHAAARLRPRDAIAAAVLSTACYAFAEMAGPRGFVFGPVVFGVSAVLIALIFSALSRETRVAPMEQAKSPSDAANLIRTAALAADADSSAAAMVDAACRALGADAARLSLADLATGRLGAGPSGGTCAGWFTTELDLAEHIRDSDEPLVLTGDIPEDLAQRGLRLPGSARAYVGAPVRVRGNLVGVLEAAWERAPVREEDLDVALVIAAEIAQQLAGAVRPVAAASLRDPVTRLWSHTEFQRRLAEEVSRAGRQGEQLAVLLVDIDAFGLINDVHGHQAGDALLAAVARRLELETRAADVLARFGSDEFAMILPYADREKGLLAGDRLREAVAQASFGLEAGVIAPVTVSVAVACFPEDGNEPRALVAAAQRALSTEGVNRVVSAREGS